MHDSEQEHSGITGCRVTYESTIFYNEANKFSIIVVKTSDPRIPPQACSGRYYGDRMLRFTAVGYELPRTKAVELELDGEWVESKYGYQLQVEQWQEIVPQTADGLLVYLGSGLIKGIGPKTAEDIVATFGPDTLNILDNEPEKLLQIRGITEGKLKDIEESYAESRVLRNLMSLLGPFKITPATALKIYQNFGPACVDILKNCPYDLCQISGFGFKRVDGIVRKTDNRLHSAERIKGAVLYTLEDARGKSGHLFLPSEDLVKETLLLLNAPIPIPEQRVRAEEVQETLQQMILHGAVVAYKQYLYSPRVFGQEDDTARMIAERLANISVAENIESALESVRESLGITLSQKQEQAVRTAFRHGLTIITGSPGTGKTTVLKAIIEVFKNLHPKGKCSNAVVCIKLRRGGFIRQLHMEGFLQLFAIRGGVDKLCGEVGRCFHIQPCGRRRLLGVGLVQDFCLLDLIGGDEVIVGGRIAEKFHTVRQDNFGCCTICWIFRLHQQRNHRIVEIRTFTDNDGCFILAQCIRIHVGIHTIVQVGHPRRNADFGFAGCHRQTHAADVTAGRCIR